jgi:hypothetical protein
MSDVVLSDDPPPPPPPVSADLQTSLELDLALPPSAELVIPFTTFVENSGSFAFTASGDGTFTMPQDGTYEVTLTLSVLNSADGESSAARLFAYMAYSGISIANTMKIFSLQPASSSTCVVSTVINGYKAGTEISASLQTGPDTLLSLVAAIDTSVPADLLVKLIA